MSPVWDQNDSLPEEFQSLQDHYLQQQQQQQQDGQQGHSAAGRRMPRLPGAPFQSNATNKNNKQPSSATRHRADQAPSLLYLPSLQAQQAHVNFNQAARYQQGYPERNVSDDDDQWPHLNAVPSPLPGVWPNLGPSVVGQNFPTIGPSSQFQNVPSCHYTSTLPPHANPLMDSYVQPDASAGCTYEGWPSFPDYHQAQQSLETDLQADSAFSPRPEPSTYRVSGRDWLDPGKGQGSGGGSFDQEDRLDPWTGLLQPTQSHAATPPLRATGSGITWGLDRDSLSLAAYASQTAGSSRGASHRASRAASQLQGSIQRSGSSTNPASKASQKHRSGELSHRCSSPAGPWLCAIPLPTGSMLFAQHACCILLLPG